jgi:hypothetical protein
MPDSKPKPRNRQICETHRSGDFFMIELKVNSGVIAFQKKNLERMMTDNPETRKAIQQLIRETMWEARNSTAHEIEGIIGNNGQTARAVRNIVFQKILGGNVNIMNMVRGTAKWKVVQKKRAVDQNPHMRGGNRRQRTMRTIQIQGYEGKARGFILRFQDSGTRQRFAVGRNTLRSRGDNSLYWGKLKAAGRGNRGNITAGNFFFRIASKYIGQASEKLAAMIDEEFEKIQNKNSI